MPVHLRYAVRTLLKQPGFTCAAVVMLAIGIGANTAMFSVVQAVLLRPIGVDAPERVVMFWPSNLQRNQLVGEMPFSDYQAFRRGNRSFEQVAIVGSTNWPGTLSIAGREPFVVPMNVVSATFFDALGARPLLGRTFREDEDQPTAPRVMVLSHGLWTRRFDRDPGVIGRTVTVKQQRGEEAFEIIGVMPPEFFFPRGAEYWTPAAPELITIARGAGAEPKEYLENFGVFYGIGRMKARTTLADARAEMNALLRAILAERKLESAGEEIVLTGLMAHIFGSAQPALKVLMGAVAVVLLIVCTNLASLLLARGAGRRREIAVRAALGATRRRLVGQVLTEGALLAVAGTALGVTVAAWSLGALVALSPADIPRLDAVSFDRSVVTFAIAITGLTALLVGLAPAWQLTRPSLVDDLKSAAAGSSGRSGTAHTRRVLVALQLGATLVLLIAAALCIQSFGRLNRLDLGFDPVNVLTFRVAGLDERYPDVTHKTDAVEQLLARFERVPHVVAAGAVYQLPFEYGPIGRDSSVILEGQPLVPETPARNPQLNWESVTPGYFRAMGIRLVRGRNFDDRDTATSPLVVIASELMASRLWPGQDPIGKRLLAYGARWDDKRQPVWQTVVGVVETARYREIAEPRLDMYVPLRQAPSFVNHFTVRTAIEPAAVAATLRAEVGSFDRTLSLDGVTTMEERVARTGGPWRFNMLVFTAFALVALGLAAVGLFALVAYAVTQRTREIGVRVALGARRRDVIRLILSEAVILAGIGLTGGLIAAALMTPILSGLLFGVSATDPATFATVTALLALVTALASYLPARRAATVDPLVALRTE